MSDNGFFLSRKSQEGFELLRKDLEKLRPKNREIVPEHLLGWLDRIQALVFVIGTILISVFVIFGVYSILSSPVLDSITMVTQWFLDFVKILKLII
jgi:hypothetical protein